jgi:hypothetical protein
MSGALRAGCSARSAPMLDACRAGWTVVARTTLRRKDGARRPLTVISSFLPSHKD